MTLASINADGWSGVYSGTVPTFTPDTAPESVALTRQGFTGAGAATTFADTRVITSRTYQAPPNDATPTTNGVALSDYVYSTDTVAGVTNNSTVTSPKPIAQWTIAPLRNWIGTISGGVMAEHRDGIACVEVWATDGTTETAHQFITAPTVENRAGDQGAVLAYQFTLDITGLSTTGMFTLRRKVYPKIGGAASVLDYNESAQDHPMFKEQKHRRKAAFYYAYLDKTLGNDATGTVKTTLGGALDPDNKPFLTIKAAIEAARAAMGDYRVEGLEMRMRAGTWTHTSGVVFNFYQDANSTDIVFTRDAATTSRAAAIFDMTGIASTGVERMAFVDCSFKRTTATYMAGQHLRFRDVNMDGGSQGFPITDQPHYYEGGIVATNIGSLFVGGTHCWMLRGVTAGALTGVSITCGNRHVVGSKILGAVLSPNSQPESGAFICSNRLSSGSADGSLISLASAASVTGAAITNNALEWNSASASAGVLISADSAAGNMSHLIWRNNTVAAQNNAGRLNVGYDDSAGTARRTHALWRFENSVVGQFNYKGWRFVYYGMGLTAEAANRTGTLPIDYGVGFRNNVYLFIDATAGASATFKQQYAGMNASIGASGAPITPGFTDYKGVTFSGSTYTAGAGGSDLKPTTVAAISGKVPAGQQNLPFDFVGTARFNNGQGAAGAYERDAPPLFGAGGGTMGAVGEAGAGKVAVQGGGGVVVAGPITTVGTLIATSDRLIVPEPVPTGTSSAASLPLAASAWPAPFDPADRTPFAIDWTSLLGDDEQIAQIDRIRMSAEGAALGVAVDAEAGRAPIISDDGKKTQFWFLCDSAFQANAAFSGAGVAIGLSVLIRTTAAPYQLFERTGVLTVRQQ
jgi:hypothetical protein